MLCSFFCWCSSHLWLWSLACTRALGENATEAMFALVPTWVGRRSSFRERICTTALRPLWQPWANGCVVPRAINYINDRHGTTLHISSWPRLDRLLWADGNNIPLPPAGRVPLNGTKLFLVRLVISAMYLLVEFATSTTAGFILRNICK